MASLTTTDLIVKKRFSSCNHLVCFRQRQLVPHIGATDPEDNVLGDVCCMVCCALQVARDDDRIQRLPADHRVLLHHLHQLVLDVTVHIVDLVVHCQHRLR